MYRLNLAHDSTIAVALSAVTVTQPARGVAREIVGRDLELEALQARVRAGAARPGAARGRSPRKRGWARRRSSTTFLQAARRAAGSRCASGVAAAPSVSPAARRTCPMLEALDSLQKNEQLGSIARLIRAVAPSWYAQIMPASDNDSSAARLAAETADRLAGAAEARDRGAVRGARPHAAGRPVLRRHALGRSVDHRSAGVPGAADRHHAPADRRDVPAVGPGAGAAIRSFR